MPYYLFLCTDCVQEFEQSYHVKSVPETRECPRCGGRMQRIFSPPVVIQKGYKESDARFNRGKG